MPYWEVFTPENAYTVEDKKAFATAITKACVDFAEIPAFFVNVRFQEIPADTMFLGGESKSNFIRIVADTIARQMPTAEEQAACMAAIGAAVAPFTTDRGYESEIHIDETPIGLWRVNGITAPLEYPDIFAQWIKENRAVPYEVPAS
ncbi:tautomerase family protein [Streptomyces sp. NBC_00631]|uniref:tautomerase family protein n=1 Tax=Streptomyces sp. NBC_00631 TaxID=2975793 RepID=UPI0030DE352B